MMRRGRIGDPRDPGLVREPHSGGLNWRFLVISLAIAGVAAAVALAFVFLLPESSDVQVYTTTVNGQEIHCVTIRDNEGVSCDWPTQP